MSSYAAAEKWKSQAKESLAIDVERAAVMAQIAHVEATLTVAERLRDLHQLLAARLR